MTDPAPPFEYGHLLDPTTVVTPGPLTARDRARQKAAGLRSAERDVIQGGGNPGKSVLQQPSSLSDAVVIIDTLPGDPQPGSRR